MLSDKIFTLKLKSFIYSEILTKDYKNNFLNRWISLIKFIISAFDNGMLQSNKHLQWILNMQAQLLPSNVQIWDSFLPISYRAIRDCLFIISQKLHPKYFLKYSRFNGFDSLSCYDKIHVGYANIYTGVQQLLNHLCNQVVAPKFSNFCCTKNF